VFCRENRPVRLLEIGVQNGGSLELWSDYLPEGSICVGLDIDSRVKDLKFDTDRVAVFICDATNREAVQHSIGDETFDIIIDDASHLCKDVIASFEIFFERLTPNGIYFIEDLHTSYYHDFGGGLRKEGSSIEFLKTIIDAINFDHVAPGERIAMDRHASLVALNQQVARIAFYDSLFVLHKLGQPKMRPYRRTMSGTTAQVCNLFPLLTQRELSSSMLVGDPLARKCDEQLLNEVERLRGNCAEFSALAEAAQQEKIQIESALQRADEEVGRLSARLAELEKSVAESESVAMRPNATNAEPPVDSS
jgi:hypothetical protein